MSLSHEDHYANAIHARSHVPAPLLWSMLKSHLYLTAGFAGASIAAIALRALTLGESSQLSTLQLVLAVLGGVALAGFAWYRAMRVLDRGTDQAIAADASALTIDHGPSAMGGFSQG